MELINWFQNALYIFLGFQRNESCAVKVQSFLLFRCVCVSIPVGVYVVRRGIKRSCLEESG
jgi:hypothetical protein